MPQKLPALLLCAVLAAFAVRASEVPDIPGWQRVGEPVSFDISTITDAIDGAAELYIAYGFELLTWQELERGEERVKLSLFDQGSPINAFGLFRRERSPEAKPVNAGAQAAAVLPYHCAMQKDRYYVRIEPAAGELTEQVCEELLGAVAKAWPGKDCPPRELAELPAQGRVPGSEGYTRRSYLGMADLPRSLHATYTARDGKRFELFTLFKKCGEKEDKTWEKLAATWKWAELGGLPALHREIPYRGHVVVAKTKRGIYGVANAGGLEEAMEALKQAVTSLKSTASK